MKDLLKKNLKNRVALILDLEEAYTMKYLLNIVPGK